MVMSQSFDSYQHSAFSGIVDDHIIYMNGAINYQHSEFSGIVDDHIIYMNGGISYQHLGFSGIVQNTRVLFRKKKKNCKNLGVGQNLMEFAKIPMPESLKFL
jgi:hypothetical protein